MVWNAVRRNLRAYDVFRAGIGNRFGSSWRRIVFVEYIDYDVAGSVVGMEGEIV